MDTSALLMTTPNVWSWSEILSTLELFFFFFLASVWQRLCFECVCRSRACVHHNEDKHSSGPDPGGAVAETVSWCGQKADWDESDGDWKDGATCCLLRWRRSAWRLFKRGLSENKYLKKRGKWLLRCYPTLWFLLSHVTVVLGHTFEKGKKWAT